MIIPLTKEKIMIPTTIINMIGNITFINSSISNALLVSPDFLFWKLLIFNFTSWDFIIAYYSISSSCLLVKKLPTNILTPSLTFYIRKVVIHLYDYPDY